MSKSPTRSAKVVLWLARPDVVLVLLTLLSIQKSFNLLVWCCCNQSQPEQQPEQGKEERRKRGRSASFLHAGQSSKKGSPQKLLSRL